MSAVDMERFRLRRFVELLDAIGELETHEEQVSFADIPTVIEASPKAVLFKQAGPERFQLVANVNGSRRRIAAAFGVEPEQAVQEYRRRIANPQPVTEVCQGAAPVQRVVVEGDGVDLTRLPFYVQHQLDGNAYISSAIDYSVDPESGHTNVGCRRISLRGKRELGINVTAPSDLRRICRACAARGEKLPISFAIGSHPLDFMAATMGLPVANETALIGTLRGEPVPLVKSRTNDVPVPADAEMILEGYLDARGYIEPEGPFGEYMGFYGPVHLDPILHITAITMREDVLHQSLLHGLGYAIQRQESTHLRSIRLEEQALAVLAASGIQPAQVHVVPGAAQHIRVALKQTRLGLARTVISALIGGIPSIKHVFVVDDDIDVTSDWQMEWAMCSRFQADRDLMLFTGIPGMPMDPSLEGSGAGCKAGFDLTLPFGRRNLITATPARTPLSYRAEQGNAGTPRFQTVRQALEERGPLFFADIMSAIGTEDGRDVSVQLEDIRNAGQLARNAKGQYLIGRSEPGLTAVIEPIDDPNMMH